MIPGVFAAAPAGAVAPSDPLAESIASKLLHWWDFDGDTVDLIRGNTLSGAASYAPGRINEMVVKGEVLFSQELAPSPPSEGVTFGGWIYIDGTDDENQMMLKRGPGSANSSTQSHYLAMRGSGTIMHLVGYPSHSNPATAPTNSITPGSFYFVVGAVHPDGKIELFIDGALLATSNAGVPLPTFDHVQFGRTPEGVYAALQNDASFIAKGVLTAEEIQWLYNGGLGRPGSALLPYTAPLAGSGAWTWFNDPRAITAGGYLIVGSTSPDGVIQAAYSSDDFAVDRRVVEFTSPYSADDHDNPAFLRRDDGKLLAFYTRHNDPNCWLRESVSPDDPTEWGPGVNLQPQLGSGPYSYNNPVQLPGEDGSPIFNFFRRGPSPDWTMSFSKSSDGGASWLAAAPLLGAGRPYFKVVRNGSSRIDFAVTDGHPDSVETNSVRHFYYESGAWFNSAGNDLGSPPFDTASELSTVYDGTITRAWVWDIQIGPDGHPRIVFSTFPSTSDHRYHYARWTGSVWQVTEICAAGGYLYGAEAYYSGGVCIDPDDVGIVYASRQIGTEWHLYRYATPDGGLTFSEQIKQTGGLYIRPYAIAGSTKFAVLAGRYNSYTDFLMEVEVHEK